MGPVPDAPRWLAPEAPPPASAADQSIKVLLGPGANGLFWNAATDTLLLADDDRHIRSWKEDPSNAAGILIAVADLPPSSTPHAGLGQLVQLADGTVVVTRFGGGTEGAVVVVRPDGTSSFVPKLDKTRRRIGLTATADGQLFDTYFVKSGSGSEGGVARLDLHGKEIDVAPGLKKPVGVLATDGALVITDQDAKQILTIPLPPAPGKGPKVAAAAPTVLASLPSADLLAAGPDGSFFTGGRDGVVRQIDAHGQVKEIVSGFHEVRGIAFDPKKNRIFFVDHDTATPGSGGTSTLIVRPL